MQTDKDQLLLDFNLWNEKRYNSVSAIAAQKKSET